RRLIGVRDRRDPIARGWLRHSGVGGRSTRLVDYLHGKGGEVDPGPRSREGARSARAGGGGRHCRIGRWDARLVVMDALTPTVLDTDPGIDDALALLLAWGSPELDVLALTVVAGNAPLADTARNAARLVAVRRPARLPQIALGAAAPLRRALVTAAHDDHGADRLRDAPDWPALARPPAPMRRIARPGPARPPRRPRPRPSWPWPGPTPSD